MLWPPRFASSLYWARLAIGGLYFALIGPRLTGFGRRWTAFIGFSLFTTLYIASNPPLLHYLFPSLFVRQQIRSLVGPKVQDEEVVVLGTTTPPSTPPSRRRFVMTTPSTPMSALSQPSPAPHHNREPLDAFVFPPKPHQQDEADDDDTFVDSPADVLAPLPTTAGSPTSPSKRESPFKRPMRPGHIRARSMLDTRQQKRLSLNLPVQPLILPPSRPTSWYAGSPLLSPEPLASPTETSFLAKLAAQERRVLELKDELKQAEQELERLKRQWALEEAQKKKGDVRRIHQLQPLSTTLPSLDCLEEDEDGSSEWLHKEMERRKLLMSNIKTSNRKVFSGSRHMRTLSLLSPERGYFPESALTSRDMREDDLSLQRQSTSSSNRSMTMHDDEQHHLGYDGQGDDLLKTSKQMAVDLKQGLLTFFEDLRQATVGEEGINATEARITQSGHKSSTATSSRARPQFAPASERRTSGGSIRRRPASWWAQPSDPLIDIAATFWRDHGIDATPQRPQSRSKKTPSPVQKTAATTKPAVSTPQSEVSDTWAWDTPSKLSDRKPTAPRAPASLTDSIGSPSSVSGPSTPSDREEHARPGASPAASTERTLTPRSSMDALSPQLEALRLQFGGLTDNTTAATPISNKKSNKVDGIPWPALQKLTPTNLRRTASHLMAEWEKSLSPPSTFPGPEEDLSFAGADAGLLISPSANRVGGKAKKKE